MDVSKRLVYNKRNKKRLSVFQDIVVITGSRSITDVEKVYECLNDYANGLSPSRIFLIGMAKYGLDAMAVQWCQEKGEYYLECPAAWDKLDAEGAVIKINSSGYRYNAKAGFDRNNEMVSMANRCVAIWDGKSKGTKQCFTKAQEAGLPTDIYKLEIS